MSECVNGCGLDSHAHGDNYEMSCIDGLHMQLSALRPPTPDEYAIPVIDADDDKPNTYHIRIDSSRDGVVIDENARGFILAGSRPDNSTGFTIERGLNALEAYGTGQWLLDHLHEGMHGGDYETDALDT